ncbi:MAG: hypothetical protein KAX28_07000, partial [Candidatus Marinimicrobia bacterium]|nr:hypothetical protein [Candidatus Neomarinimicrobiota bacterium]
GEGQHPEKFEDTFLSLIAGNKWEIQFVQGKYNMGGSGAIVFCGKKSYQLIGSKRFDGTGKFGYTLIREHPLTEEEHLTRKNTWYEYFKINGEIPSFDINKMDLKLYNRLFTTGTIIKLYSYDLPSGSRSVISRDLNQSINEYLFEPALPITTIDKKERYPDDINLERDLYGLKRRLEKDDNKYIDEHFTEEYNDELFGKMIVTCYVFKSKVNGKSVKETRETIRREFFKNNMSVLFSLNGQVHGHYTAEFITRSLKMNLLKSHLLIHVDCTHMDYEFRKELFMASRDRLKDGEETRNLRRFLATKLSKSGSRLWEIEKRRKDSISVESSDANQMIRDFTKNLPMNSELMKLLDQTFKLDLKDDKHIKKEKERKKTKKKEEKQPFKPERFPTCFKLMLKNDGEKEITKIPLGGEKSIPFQTDAEDHYFDRVEEPGELKIALLDFKRNEVSGGNAPGKIERVQDVINVNKSGPKEGSIKLIMNPTQNAQAGDALKIKTTLTAPGQDFEEVFWVKISEPKAPKEKTPKEEKIDESTLGLPEFVLVYRESHDNFPTWDDVELLGMDWNKVMYPLAEGE